MNARRIAADEKICLVQPPIEDFYQSAARNIPLGLMQLGAMIRAHTRHPVQLVDLRFGERTAIAVPPDLRAAAPYFRRRDASPFALYKRYYRFGVRDEDISGCLPGDSRIFCVAAQFTAYTDELYRLLSIIRKHSPEAWIIAGGNHASVRPETLLARGVDFVVAGEGEEAILALLAELQQEQPDFAGVPNLVFQRAGETLYTQRSEIADLDSLPFADVSIPGLPEYRLQGRRHTMLMASRGCSHRCRFCGIHHSMGSRYRLRSVRRVITEMQSKVEMGFRSFDFEDDHFGGSREWLDDLLDGILESFGEQELRLHAMNGITVSNLTASILRKMKRAGFEKLDLSLVTPRQDRQLDLGRPVGTAEFVRIVREAVAVGLPVTAYLILGLPGDRPPDNLDAILSLAELPCRIGPSLFYLVPGTRLHADLDPALREAISFRQFRASYFPYARGDYSRRAAMTLLRICRMLNFIKELLDHAVEPQPYRIGADRILLTQPSMNGRQTRDTLGWALLELFFSTGKLYGTQRKMREGYPIREEIVDQSLLDDFRTGDWKISAACDKQEIGRAALVQGLQLKGKLVI